MTSFKQFSELSINLWINMNTEQYSKFVFSPLVFKFEYKTDGNGFLYNLKDSIGSSFTVRSGDRVKTNQWQMVTMTYNKSTFEAYLNGNSVGSVEANGNITKKGNKGIAVGRIDGKMQDFRLYESGLTGREVQKLYDVVDKHGTLISSEKTL